MRCAFVNTCLTVGLKSLSAKTVVLATPIIFQSFTLGITFALTHKIIVPFITVLLDTCVLYVDLFSQPFVRKLLAYPLFYKAFVIQNITIFQNSLAIKATGKAFFLILIKACEYTTCSETFQRESNTFAQLLSKT